MAQWIRRSRWFEGHWQERRELATKVLRDVEDAWLQSHQSFPTRETVAVLLRIFAFDAYSADLIGYQGTQLSELWRRKPGDWLSVVGSPEAECDRLSPRREGSERLEVIELLVAKLQTAVDSWERVGPDQPPCEEIVQQLIDELANRRFLVIKYD